MSPGRSSAAVWLDDDGPAALSACSNVLAVEDLAEPVTKLAGELTDLLRHLDA
jgi:hypothetical protein